MVAQTHLTVNVICTLTVLSLFISTPHLSETLLPVCHHIPTDSTVHNHHHQHLRSHMWHIEPYALLILVLCLAQAVSHWPGFNPRPISVEYVGYRVSVLQISVLALRSAPVYNVHLFIPLLYNLTIQHSCSVAHSFSIPILSPVLCNPSLQKFASFYYQVQNTVLGPRVGLLNVPQFPYII